MKKTSVLMVMGSTGMGGTQAFVLNLLQNLDLNEYQIDFVVDNEKPDGIGDAVKALGSKIYLLPYFKIYNYWGYVKAWKKFLTEHPYDIVHGHSTNSASIYLRVAKEMGCSTIAHCHSAGFRGNVMHRFLKFIYSRKVKKVADYWFACSDKAARHLYGNKYKDYKHYYLIPNAINVERYLYDESVTKRIRKLIGVNEGDFLCGHVGTFSAPKNHNFLMDIFAEVQRVIPNAKFICCGTGPLLAQVKEKAKALGIIGDIIFPGVVMNCNEYLMAMDVFVFPSFFEGFPISVIEAEATGLPVVMSDVITSEVDLTDCIHRLSLDYSADYWAKTICSLTKGTRRDYNELIAISKYNMKYSIDLISNLYKEMVTDKIVQP